MRRRGRRKGVRSSRTSCAERHICPSILKGQRSRHMFNCFLGHTYDCCPTHLSHTYTHFSAFRAETWQNITSDGVHYQRRGRRPHLSCGICCRRSQCCRGIRSDRTAESLVSTGCERLSLAVPLAAVDVLCTSRDRTHPQDGGLCGQEYVVCGGT